MSKQILLPQLKLRRFYLVRLSNWGYSDIFQTDWGASECLNHKFIEDMKGIYGEFVDFNNDAYISISKQYNYVDKYIVGDL